MNYDASVVFKYQFIVLSLKVPEMSSYWSRSPVYCGLWARRFLSRDRFKALLAMLHVADPGQDVRQDKLGKIRPLLAHIKQVISL